MKLLLGMQCDPNAITNTGLSPLHISVQVRVCVRVCGGVHVQRGRWCCVEWPRWSLKSAIERACKRIDTESGAGGEHP
jgi:hypothetical protein